MPWCEPCGKFYNPNTLDEDGRCPQHHPVAEPNRSTVSEETQVPWHFWVLAIAVLLYLAWRFVQLIGWLV